MRATTDIDTPTKDDLTARDELIAELQAEVRSLRAQLRRQERPRLDDLLRFMGRPTELPD